MDRFNRLLSKYFKKVPKRHLSRLILINEQLKKGTSIYCLDGKYLGNAKRITSFKLGRNWRAIFVKNQNSFEVIKIVSRQHLKKFIKRL